MLAPLPLCSPPPSFQPCAQMQRQRLQRRHLLALRCLLPPPGMPACCQPMLASAGMRSWHPPRPPPPRSPQRCARWQVQQALLGGLLQWAQQQLLLAVAVVQAGGLGAVAAAAAVAVPVALAAAALAALVGAALLPLCLQGLLQLLPLAVSQVRRCCGRL